MNSTGTGKTENLEAQIVIMGSGGAGLAAAVTAAEKGVKDIIILEKRRNLGGNSARAEGIFACESPVQKRMGIDVSRDEYFKKFMRWAHWGRVNSRIVRAYINKSGDTIRWLEEEGLDFEVVKSQPNEPPLLGANVWHLPAKGPEGRNGARLIKVLDRNYKALGGQLLLNTPGKKILRGTKGEITGVVAVKGEGEEFQIKAKSVIIATGGFAGNTELLKKYCPEYSDGVHPDGNSIPHTGDGLLMAREIGAAIGDSVSLLKEGPRADTYPWGVLQGIVMNTNTVWVNKKGKRFIDEGAGYMIFESGNAILAQPGKVMYTLFDEKIRQDAEEAKPVSSLLPHAVPTEKELRKRAAEDGAAIKISDSWDEIANWIGADPKVLKATIDEYNSFCDKEYDEDFVKDKRDLLPLRKPPYYAIRGVNTYMDTLGGIKTNEHMEVLDNQENIITGLYAAGVIVNGFEGETYCSELSGSAFGFSVNSGRIAGESAADYVLDK